MYKKICYRSSSPAFQIRVLSAARLGRCYNETVYQIRSDTKIVDPHVFFPALRAANLLGYGQEFGYTKDPVEEVELLMPVELDEAGNVLDSVPINPYSGESYEPAKKIFYVYTATDRCDSGD